MLLYLRPCSNRPFFIYYRRCLSRQEVMVRHVNRKNSPLPFQLLNQHMILRTQRHTTYYHPRMRTNRTTVKARPTTMLFRRFPISFSIIMRRPRPALSNGIIMTRRIKPLRARRRCRLYHPSASTFRTTRLPSNLVIQLLPSALRIGFSTLSFPNGIHGMFDLSRNRARTLRLLGPNSRSNDYVRRTRLVPRPLPSNHLHFHKSLLTSSIICRHQGRINVRFPLSISHLYSSHHRPLISYTRVHHFHLTMLRVRTDTPLYSAAFVSMRLAMSFCKLLVGFSVLVFCFVPSLLFLWDVFAPLCLRIIFLGGTL